MKKNFIFAAIVLFGVSAFAWDGSQNIPCVACKEATVKTAKGYSYCMGCPAWRMYAIEKDGYMRYNCPHGHNLRIPNSSENSSRDVTEIEVLAKNGWRKMSPLED